MQQQNFNSKIQMHNEAEVFPPTLIHVASYLTAAFIVNTACAHCTAHAVTLPNVKQRLPETSAQIRDYYLL